MNIMRQVVVFDAADLAAQSGFWAGVLDGRVVEDNEDGWHSASHRLSADVVRISAVFRSGEISRSANRADEPVCPADCGELNTRI